MMPLTSERGTVTTEAIPHDRLSTLQPRATPDAPPGNAWLGPHAGMPIDTTDAEWDVLRHDVQQ